MWVCHGNAIKPAGDSQVPEELWQGQHPPPQPSSSTPSPPHPFPLIPHSVGLLPNFWHFCFQNQDENTYHSE